MAKKPDDPGPAKYSVKYDAVANNKFGNSTKEDGQFKSGSIGLNREDFIERERQKKLRKDMREMREKEREREL